MHKSPLIEAAAHVSRLEEIAKAVIDPSNL